MVDTVQDWSIVPVENATTDSMLQLASPDDYDQQLINAIRVLMARIKTYSVTVDADIADVIADLATVVAGLPPYETGAWPTLPSFACGGASVGMTYSARSAQYTKIGRLVFATFDITLSAKGSSTGALTITNLPFTAISSATPGGLVASFCSGWNALDSNPFGTVNAGATTSSLRMNSPAGTGTSGCTDVQLTNTTRLLAMCTYQSV